MARQEKKRPCSDFCFKTTKVRVRDLPITIAQKSGAGERMIWRMALLEHGDREQLGTAGGAVVRKREIWEKRAGGSGVGARQLEMSLNAVGEVVGLVRIWTTVSRHWGGEKSKRHCRAKASRSWGIAVNSAPDEASTRDLNARAVAAMITCDSDCGAKRGRNCGAMALSRSGVMDEAGGRGAGGGWAGSEAGGEAGGGKRALA